MGGARRGRGRCARRRGGATRWLRGPGEWRVSGWVHLGMCLEVGTDYDQGHDCRDDETDVESQVARVSSRRMGSELTLYRSARS